MSEEEKRSESEPGAAIDSGRRRAPWKTSFNAVNYIYSVLTDKDIRLRNTDKATNIALLIGTVCVLLSSWITPLGKLRGNLVAICDLFAGIILVFYIANRFGIINTLPRRQALLIWQLLLVFTYLGIYLTINVAVIIAYFISDTSLTPTP